MQHPDGTVAEFKQYYDCKISDNMKKVDLFLRQLQILSSLANNGQRKQNRARQWDLRYLSITFLEISTYSCINVYIDLAHIFGNFNIFVII